MTDPLLETAKRMWDAAYELDRLRGDDAATDWVAGKVNRMIDGTLPDDLETVSRMAEALQMQLEKMETT